MSEQLSCILCDLVGSMSEHRKLTKPFWVEALSDDAHVRNRVTSLGISSTTTPYELLFGQGPDLSPLRVFGCRCWDTPRSSLKMLVTHAAETILIVYSSGSLGYNVWSLAAPTSVVLPDVHFERRVGSHLFEQNILEIGYSLDESGHDICSHSRGQEQHTREQLISVSSEGWDDVQVWHPSEMSRGSTRTTRKTGSRWDLTPSALLSSEHSEPMSFKEA